VRHRQKKRKNEQHADTVGQRSRDRKHSAHMNLLLKEHKHKNDYARFLRLAGVFLA
jgi:hypothetical protein